jgi:hypothetical protein
VGSSVTEVAGLGLRYAVARLDGCQYTRAYKGFMLPRTVQILGGLFVAAYSVLTMGCAVVMFNWPDHDRSMMISMIGLIIEASAIWTFVKAADLVFGRRTQGGLIGATALRIIAALYTLMLTLGVVMGEVGHSLGAKIVALVGGACMVTGLLATARLREAIKKVEDSRRLRA